MAPHTCASRFALHPFSNSPVSSREHSGLTCLLRRLSLSVVGLFLLFAGQSKLTAQVSESQPDYYDGQTYSPSQQVLRPMQPLSAGQLEQLVAPIALYPDALVAQILAASTYPQQVADADRWRQERAYATPEQIAAEADAQLWDPSVKALTAFPQVLAQMDRNLQWTTDLGNAYYNQAEDVLEAVQVMRRRAQAAGNLQSTPQEIVRYNDGYIQLAPADPQVVYVPAYNPWTIYGEPIAPYPGFTLAGVLGEIFGATPLRYGLGIAMAAFTHTPWGWLAWGLDWLTHALLFDHSNYYSHSNTVADWGFRHTGFHAYSGHGGFGRSGFVHSGMQMHGERWRHDGYAGGPWHSFAHDNMFAGNRSGEWHSFARSNTVAENWRRGSSGIQSFRGVHTGTGIYSRSFSNPIQRNHTAYGASFDHAPASNFRQGRFGNWSSGRSSGSYVGSNYESSRRSAGRSGHSGGLDLFGGGRSQRSFGGRSWGGFHSGGGGHVPKSFGGRRSFGGGHSRGAGHSGGHGGGSKHRR